MVQKSARQCELFIVFIRYARKAGNFVLLHEDHGHIECLNCLVNHGAVVAKENKQVLNSLLLDALKNGQANAIHILHSVGTKWPHEDFQSALNLLPPTESREECKHLLENFWMVRNLLTSP